MPIFRKWDAVATEILELAVANDELPSNLTPSVHSWSTAESFVRSSDRRSAFGLVGKLRIRSNWKYCRIFVSEQGLTCVCPPNKMHLNIGRRLKRQTRARSRSSALTHSFKRNRGKKQYTPSNEDWILKPPVRSRPIAREIVSNSRTGRRVFNSPSCCPVDIDRVRKVYCLCGFEALIMRPEVREICQRKRARVEKRGCKYRYLLCVLSRALLVTWCVVKSAVSMREILDRALLSSWDQSKVRVGYIKVWTDVPCPSPTSMTSTCLSLEDM